jgi:hypothetical protein
MDIYMEFDRYDEYTWSWMYMMDVNDGNIPRYMK